MRAQDPWVAWTLIGALLVPPLGVACCLVYVLQGADRAAAGTAAATALGFAALALLVFA